MGNGLPEAVAAKVDFPDCQVWSLSGDGGFSTVIQDVIATFQYKLLSINVVFSNKEYGFIKHEQEETNHNYFGVDFTDVDYAEIGEAQGAVSFTVTKYNQLKDTFEKAVLQKKQDWNRKHIKKK